MRRIRWGALALTAIVGACNEDQTTTLAPYEAGPLVIAAQADLEEVGEAAADPYLTELVAALEADDQAEVGEALASFGAGVTTAPGQSYLRFQAALSRKGVPPVDGESDAPVAHEVLDFYRAWSESKLFGTDH